MSTTAPPTTTGTAACNRSAPAGLLTITQPPQTTIAFFKIAPSQPISFAWNFSYVLSTPASLTVSAICENGNTYPVGPTDGKIPGTATNVVTTRTVPLAQATYTLEIFDERGPGSARAPGLLQPNNALRFALYTPQSYTPIASGWQCTTCKSGALPTAHPAFFCICLTIFVMFASGFAILRNAAR
ncbi:hypothetical protein F5148DRAFT_1274912 [Russula earlei]|uniref:Uncharacterized protein n=1 Tax=Russula earlei TaxID=71964 RepID=A0ACC0UH85_9AGAM|nr:hypothetical protein F5148DRAFT_1274912 [Russula earlei]